MSRGLPAAMALHRQRGVAALTVVMVLFFVMALVAAYTNRNLIFEQRISANNYRAARASSATDAAADWALAMLNGGRVDIHCKPSTDSADTDFRRRYMVDLINPAKGQGAYALTWGNNLFNRMYPACILRHDANGLPAQDCICPSASAATTHGAGLVVPDNRFPPFAVATSGVVGSAFRISFYLPGNDNRPGSMEFSARGCASLGSGDTACFSKTDDPVVDSVSRALSTVALVPALPRPAGSPAMAAALTAGATIDAVAGGLVAGGGVRAGGAVTGINSASGSPNDAALQKLAAAPNEAWFRTLFGMDSASYRRQPAVVICPAGCTLDALKGLVRGHPRNPIWVEGNVNIDGAAALGAAPPAGDPLLLIVNGTLTMSANAQIIGFVYANRVNLEAGANGSSLTGAMVSKEAFTAATTSAGPFTLSYDAGVLDFISLRYGSFVRVPGSWNLTNVP